MCQHLEGGCPEAVIPAKEAVIPAKAGIHSALTSLIRNPPAEDDRCEAQTMNKESAVYILASKRNGTLYVGSPAIW